MRFSPTELSGVVVIDIEPIDDDRGFFARAWCTDEFASAGLHATFVQENVGYSIRAGTLRGLHFQRAPFEETKLVRCTAGSAWDVVVDLRPASETYGQWVGVELSAERRNMVYVPEGCAHGYLTTADKTEVRYLTSQAYAPDAATGVRFDDEALAIAWPREVAVVSEQDRSWPPLQSARSGAGP